MDGSSDSTDTAASAGPTTTASSPAPPPAREGTRALDELQGRLGVRWESIARARDKTEEIVANLRAELRGLEDPNCSVIVTGSLGRGEADEGSDADWLLLVDGPSDPQHARLAREIGTKIRKVVSKDVGPTGTFGEIVASHDLVHYIAGSHDTNKNLTRRMLLLAESRALSNDVVRERVIRNVLARYLHDRPVSNKREPGRYDPTPYFLLNDVVRYWRTVASDFASKMWERTYHGWGIRNIKLRFSRKMLFVWGLLAAFSGKLFDEGELSGAASEEEFLLRLLELIRKQTDVAPLELLARVALAEGVTSQTVERIFSNYDEFLGALADPKRRKHLETMSFEDAGTDEIYESLRQPSYHFRTGINDLFFKEHEQLSKLILKFAVF